MSIQRYDILHPKMRDKGRFVLYADHIADKDAELHNLLSTLADIRIALGVGEKPMLSELAGIVREVREQADRDEKTACKALAQRDAAVRERDAAVEALRWYANNETLVIVQDGGRMARAALAKIGGRR